MKKQCDYLVSNHIIVDDINLKGYAVQDFFKKLGKYTLNHRIATIQIATQVRPYDSIDSTLSFISSELEDAKNTLDNIEVLETSVIKSEWDKLYDLERLLNSISNGDTYISIDGGDTTIVELKEKINLLAKIVLDSFEEISKV